MSEKPYRWCKCWVLMGDAGEFDTGDVVLVENSNADITRVEITAVVPWTTKAGKDKEYAHVRQMDQG